MYEVVEAICECGGILNPKLLGDEFYYKCEDCGSIEIDVI